MTRYRRVSKKVNGVLVKGWLYKDSLKPIAELDGSGNVVATFVYGSKYNTPDYVIKGGVTYRIVSDHLGSPRLSVDSATGAITANLEYDEFGNILSDTNPDFIPFGFAGGLYDPDTGLVRFGARDYDPVAGRWSSKDPIRFRREINLYGYAATDAINYIDMTGLAREKIDGKNITVHKNDRDPWPSNPHGHDYDKRQVIDKEGNIYDKSTKENVGKLSKQGTAKWLRFLKNLGKLGGMLGLLPDILFPDEAEAPELDGDKENKSPMPDGQSHDDGDDDDC